MTIEFYNLPMHLYKADNAQQVQNLFLMQERTGLELAQAATDNRTGELAEQVEDSDESTGSTIQEDDGTGGSATPQQRQQQSEEPEEPAPPPPDPDGRGTIFDFRA